MKKKIVARVGAIPKIEKYYSGRNHIQYTNLYESSISMYTSLNDLITLLQNLRHKYVNEYEDLHIDSVRDCGCYGDCGCSPTFYIQGTRLETDLEYEFRLKDEALRQAERDERDRKEYEALKAKFEGKK